MHEPHHSCACTFKTLTIHGGGTYVFHGSVLLLITGPLTNALALLTLCDLASRIRKPYGNDVSFTSIAWTCVRQTCAWVKRPQQLHTVHQDRKKIADLGRTSNLLINLTMFQLPRTSLLLFSRHQLPITQVVREDPRHIWPTMSVTEYETYWSAEGSWVTDLTHNIRLVQTIGCCNHTHMHTSKRSQAHNFNLYTTL